MKNKKTPFICGQPILDEMEFVKKVKVKLPTPNITEKTYSQLKKEISRLNMAQNVKEYLLELPLYEKEAVQMIEFLKKNPTVSEKKAIEEVDSITLAMTKELGMTAMQRDKLYPLG